MTNNNLSGEDMFKAAFAFTLNVPTKDHAVLRDYLYKFNYNLREVIEYKSLLDAVTEIDISSRTELIFRIQVMATQCIAMGIRRITDPTGERSLNQFVPLFINDEIALEQLNVIKTIYSHYKHYLNKGVAHQDKNGILNTLGYFPDTIIIEDDIFKLKLFYENVVTQICTKYISIPTSNDNYNFRPELSKIISK